MLDRGTVLVTGAAGLIGSAVVWALNQRGHERIIAVDRLDKSDKWRNLVPLRFDDYIEADALPDKIERGLLKDVRTVVHLGACSSTTETDGRYLVENNFTYTKMLAEWALQHGHPVRLRVVSSDLRRARRPALRPARHQRRCGR